MIWFPGFRGGARAVPDGGPLYRFTITLGSLGPYIGYSDGTFFPELGSMDPEIMHEEYPLSAVLIFADYTSGGFLIIGDAQALLSGRSVWIDDVEYPLNLAWTYAMETNLTSGGWEPPDVPLLEPDETYLIEIR